ncbi:cyclic nucleotide-binding domain-containing protein [Aurantimonas sp. C2-6-R+9]|uniref:cyclic nucleotide-binding domain-containing protein n=1 Tax=unclassified Aurantimonas TaxID=2638230 RepID=UPI002E170043|nr:MULTISPECIES: cyclic nucleotide-binding domain-containing protein [unclassified Aurantimonas]MEC5289673.1 cyclic nucleotide-binding domain-containing protein [Aurantimonas sp. C2-3-R2]MEC5322238.1 cyclic nucleotide-binding domain-containing protein [Aurantimonas sp. A3-2-R12]MEC5379639.1 cyclic nucleotide-binding domain-containing protein [Aurantimonas sp. C2-6-R+9]MEC5410890.1 cyclic nucleotide-binding domain-containing protein [Aurantimonas sp. C2-4-R8]
MDLLRSVPIFAGIEPSRLKLIAFTADSIAYRAGQALVRQGQPGDAAYVLVEGKAEVSVETESGDYVVATLGPGDVVGEISILCDSPRTATVTASTDVSALRVRKDSFLQLLRQFPEIAAEVMRSLAERLTHTNEELVRARNLAASRDGEA